MLAFLSENIGSIAVLLALLLIVTLSTAFLIRKKRRGGCSCGSGCGSCPMAGKCHEGKTEK